MRMIQRQREQFAYRIATTEPTKLYRGIRVNLPPELVAEMKEKLADPRTAEEAGRELDLGPKILNYLATNPWEASVGGALHDWKGLGPHWHTDPRFAHTAAYGDLDERQQGLGKRDFPFLMTAEWDGQGQVDTFGGDSLEHETQVGQGTPLKITSLIYQPELEPDGSAVKRYAPMGGSTSIELLHNPVYDRHGIPSGGPLNYTAIRRVAAAADTTIDDILKLLGEPGRADYTRPSPTEKHDPIPGVPEGWERYVTQLSGQPAGEHDLMLPTDVIDHYKEYERDTDSDQAKALEHIIRSEGVRNPVQISTDGTHAMLYEGNNRLALAKKLGITHLPVRVTYESPGKVVRNEGTPVPLEPVLADWVGKNKHRLRSFWA